MTALPFLTILVLAAAVVTIATAWTIRASRTPEPSWLQQATRRRILVQTAAGETVDGLLVAADEHGLTLEPAKVEDRDVAGQVWVPRDGVRWVQRPPA